LAAITGKYYNLFRSPSFQASLFMRSNLLASFPLAMLLAGCAFEGVVVEKRSRPLPDSSVIGTEGVCSFAFRGPTGTSRPPITVPIPQFWTGTNGIYTFLLRDRQGTVRSQMVTAAVFARYRVGDYFNDQQLSPETSDSKDKTVAGVIHHRRHYRMAQTRRTHRKVAMHRRHHSTKAGKAIILRASPHVSQG
jgi:hypothetical protein